MVGHEDDLLGRIGFGGRVLFGDADRIALAAAEDSAVFQPDFRCQGGHGKQNHKSAGHAGCHPTPTVPRALHFMPPRFPFDRLKTYPAHLASIVHCAPLAWHVKRYLTTARIHDTMGGMIRNPVFSKVLLALLVAGLVLPIVICVVLGLASLLDAMQDFSGGKVLRYVSLGGGALWVVVLIGLVLVVAIHVLGRSDDAEQ
jgi:hypothetical protein